jgi:hypothetical protein
MLDNTPEAERIFRAGILEGKILGICRRISISSEKEARLMLVKDAEAVLHQMHELAVQDFAGKRFILENLQGLRRAIQELAELPLRFRGENVCPACGEPITVLPDPSSSKVCSNCTERIIDYRQRLASDDGFMTSWI